MPSDDDAGFVERVLGGDKSAFGSLIDRHRSPAVAFARRLLGPEDAEDVVQEALLAAFLGLSNLRARERFRSWLLGIVINLCRTRLRTRREGHFEDPFGGRAVTGFSLEDTEPSPEVIHETRELHRLVFEAIGGLPSEEQGTVRLHYVEGLKLREIAILTGVPVGTLKARLHHARARLRKSLASEIAPVTARDAEGGFSMIEVRVHDVVVRSPKDDAAKWLAQGREYKLGVIRVILLKERDGNRILPIWVGAIEGDLIEMLLEDIQALRPTTFDLTAQLLKIGKMKIEKVAVTSLREDTFYGSIWLRADGKAHEVDARPSDAITLALQTGAPIFVALETFEQAARFVLSLGHELRELEEHQRKSVAEGKIEPDLKEMEYRSFRSLPRADAPWLRARTQ